MCEQHNYFADRKQNGRKVLSGSIFWLGNMQQNHILHKIWYIWIVLGVYVPVGTDHFWGGNHVTTSISSVWNFTYS